MAELIRLENIRKSYGENEVLKNITISIQEKEFVTLLGPSDHDAADSGGIRKPGQRPGSF